jgi:hypothetical protein
LSECVICDSEDDDEEEEEEDESELFDESEDCDKEVNEALDLFCLL